MARFTRGEPSPRKVKATPRQMVAGAARAATQAVRSGKASAEVHAERLATCQACPEFIQESKRCSKCGCYMEAKAWVGGDAKKLCPLNRWVR